MRHRLEEVFLVGPFSVKEDMHALDQREPGRLFVVQQQAPDSVVRPVADPAGFQMIR